MNRRQVYTKVIVAFMIVVLTGCGIGQTEKKDAQYQLIQDGDKKEETKSSNGDEIESFADAEPIQESHVLQIGDTATRRLRNNDGQVSITINRCEITKNYLGERFSDYEEEWFTGIKCDGAHTLLENQSYVWIWVEVKNTGEYTVEWAPGGENLVIINNENYLSQVMEPMCGKAFYTDGKGTLNGDRHELYENIAVDEERSYLLGYIVDDQNVDGLGYYIGYSTCMYPNSEDWVIRLGE